MDQRRWQENGTNQSLTSPGSGGCLPWRYLPFWPPFPSMGFHLSLHDPIWIHRTRQFYQPFKFNWGIFCKFPAYYTEREDARRSHFHGSGDELCTTEYTAEKWGGIGQGSQLPRAQTAMRQGKIAVHRDANFLHPAGDQVNWFFIILSPVSYKQNSTNVKMVVETCSFPKEAHSHFSDSGRTNTSRFTACQFLLKSLPSGSWVLRKYLRGLEACRILS